MKLVRISMCTAVSALMTQETMRRKDAQCNSMESPYKTRSMPFSVYCNLFQFDQMYALCHFLVFYLFCVTFIHNLEVFSFDVETLLSLSGQRNLTLDFTIKCDRSR